jgi:hypothetical protein
MAPRDGRDAAKPYRVRVGPAWYWVDPTVPATGLEVGDTVVIYPVKGEAHVAVLQSEFAPGRMLELASLAGERFAVAAADVAAVHLAAVDDAQ